MLVDSTLKFRIHDPSLPSQKKKDPSLEHAAHVATNRNPARGVQKKKTGTQHDLASVLCRLRPCITAQRKGMLRDHLTHITSNHRTKCSKPSRNLTRVPSFSLHKTKTKCPGPIKSNTFS